MEQAMAESVLPAKGLFRVDEASGYLSCSARQVRDLLDSGHLKGVCVGDARRAKRRHLRVTRESLESFINGRA